MSNGWRQIYTNAARNTAIAASANEIIFDTSDRAKQEYNVYGPFNALFVTNQDKVSVRIRLDQSTDPEKNFDLPPNSQLSLLPEEGIFFQTITQVNLSADVAQTADKITFRWSKLVRN